jgi:threonine/homoserine/homoserine lactone efflux protein
VAVDALLITGPALAAFALASLVLAASPGPAVLYIVARTLSQGRNAGLVSVAGVAVGNLANALAASIGLAALFAVSSLAFDIVRYGGAAYLVYLGVQALRRPPAKTTAQRFAAPDLPRIFRDAVVVALLNPKTTLFFAAFLPQFMNPLGSTVVQGLTLGTLFVLIALVTDSLYVLAAGALGARFVRTARNARWGRWATAGSFIGLGLYAAASGARAPR